MPRVSTIFTSNSKGFIKWFFFSFVPTDHIGDQTFQMHVLKLQKEYLEILGSQTNL